MGRIGIIAVAGLLGLGACGGGMTTSSDAGGPLPVLQDVTAEEWSALARRRIFFGHQSVGGNIMDGVVDLLAAHPRIGLTVIESRDVARSNGFHHAAVGRNDYPLEKFDEFATVAATGFGQDGGIAMVKLCYIDFHRDTDVAALFAEYQRRVNSLKAANPSLTVVHFTAPLTTIENWKGRLRAFVERRATERERNLVRHRYNEMVRTAYQGKEPVFDIAALESRLPDGRRTVYGAAGQAVPLLAPRYTDDGSHLNVAARRMVAEQLLILLAKLPVRTLAASAGT